MSWSTAANKVDKARRRRERELLGRHHGLWATRVKRADQKKMEKRLAKAEKKAARGASR